MLLQSGARRATRHNDEHQQGDENAAASTTTITVKSSTKGLMAAKTPSATGTRRRALGDISNRKHANVNNAKAVIAAPVKTVTFQTPGRPLQKPKQQQQQQPRTKTPFATASTKKKSMGKKKKSDNFVLPQQQQRTLLMRETSKPELRINSTTKPRAVAESVEDVELPAGRLWNPDDFFSDDATELSFELDPWATDLAGHAADEQMYHARIEEERFAEMERQLAKDIDELGKQDDEYVRSIAPPALETLTLQDLEDDDAEPWNDYYRSDDISL